MSQPSTQDLVKPLDPTGYASITGAQLAQLADGLAPYTDKGLVLVSTDAGLNPAAANVPNASVTTKWQNYIWVRIMATTINVYAWNKNGNTVVDQWGNNILNWVPINGVIAPQSIVTANVFPHGLNPLVCLAGSGTPKQYLWTDPSNANNIAFGGPNPILDLATPTSANANALVALDGTGLVYKFLTTPTAGNANNILGLDATGLNYAFKSATSVGRILQIVALQSTTFQNSNKYFSVLTTMTQSNADGMTDFSNVVFTPLSASSKILVEASIKGAADAGFLQVGLFSGSTLIDWAANNQTFGISLSLAQVIPSGNVPITFSVYVAGTVAGSPTAVTMNQTHTASTIKITEYI